VQDLECNRSPLKLLGHGQPPDSRTPDMVRTFTQSEQAADTVILAGPGCIAAGQRLAGSQIES